MHYTGPSINVVFNNLKSANQLPEIVHQKISKELKEGRVAGPFDLIPIKTLHVSISFVPRKQKGNFE